MYDALDIARYVINYCNQKGYLISNLRVQKLLYFIQAYYVTEYNKPCFYNTIEAYDFGPVINDVYNEYKCHGNSHIPYIKTYIQYDRNNIWNSSRLEFDANIIFVHDQRILEFLIDSFSSYESSDLLNIIQHQTPWIQAFYQSSDHIITNKMLSTYFD